MIVDDINWPSITTGVIGIRIVSEALDLFETGEALLVDTCKSMNR